MSLFFLKIFRLKGKIQKYFTDILNECNIREGFDKFEYNLKNKMFLISNFDEYVNQESESEQRNQSRLLLFIMIRIMFLLIWFKLVFLYFIKDVYTRLLLMDYTLILENGELGLITAIIIGIGVLFAFNKLTYLELTRQLKIIEIIYKIKYNLIEYPLNYSNKRKYGLKLNLMTKLLSKRLNNSINFFGIIAYIILTLELQSRFENNLITIFSCIFWNIYHDIVGYFIGQHFLYAIILWFVSTYYLRLKFEEIDTKIELSLKQRNIRLLMNAIHEHNYVERLTRDFNQFFRQFLFVLYFLLTFSMQMMLAFAQNESNIFFKLILSFISFTTLSILSAMNITCAQICSEAHKPYSTLFSIITDRNIRMSSRIRCKLLSFMEKLSGREIGFYCYDLFPMNNWEFYQYLYIAGSNYFLIMSLF